MWAFNTNAATWDWTATFTNGTDTGTFVTDNGTAGTYKITGFSVNTSDQGHAIGSIADGIYVNAMPSGYSNYFTWDGSGVTKAYNDYNADPYMEFETSDLFTAFMFGLSPTTDNTGVQFSAACDPCDWGGNYTLTPEFSAVSAVPLPPAALMFAPALLGFMGLRCKSKLAATA